MCNREFTVSQQILGYLITAKTTYLDDGIHVLLFGGCKSHVGAISYTNQHQDVQTIQFIGHRDGAVSENWAVRLRKISKGTVVVCCGIHYDHVSQKEIEQIVDKTNELLKEVEEKIVMYKVI